MDPPVSSPSDKSDHDTPVGLQSEGAQHLSKLNILLQDEVDLDKSSHKEWKDLEEVKNAIESHRDLEPEKGNPIY